MAKRVKHKVSDMSVKYINGVLSLIVRFEGGKYDDALLTRTCTIENEWDLRITINAMLRPYKSWWYIPIIVIENAVTNFCG